MFKEYLHIEKFGNTEVEGIELGITHVFPKIDGTNSSAWGTIEGLGTTHWMEFHGGSRTRELSLENDNAGFYSWLSAGDTLVRRELAAQAIRNFLTNYPHLRLYGEWLVPHTFTGYRPDAWHRFYIFDVYNDATEQYLSYDQYKPLLDEFGVIYIPPLAIIKNADYERFLHTLKQNFFLIPDGGDPGEGIVIKNYDYQNKFGRQCFAKIIRNEFKETHHRIMGAPEINNSLMNEERIVNNAVGIHLVEKTMAKIVVDAGGWSSSYIPRLLNTVFYDLVREELWDQLKEIKFGTVNFKTLKALTINKIKNLKPEIFTR